MTRPWTEAELAAIVKRNGARLIERGQKAEPLKVREKLPKATKATRAQISTGEAFLALQLHNSGIQGWVREHRFHPHRRWRVDFAFEGCKLAIEVEGGEWTNGRHNRGKGFSDDCIKYNNLTLLGWRLLRFTTTMVRKGEALQMILEVLNRSTNHAQSSQNPVLALAGATQDAPNEPAPPDPAKCA